LNTRQKGNLAEDKSVQFLIQNGYKIIERNFYSRFGEIDIIAEKDDILHFVEVKSGDSFQPIYNVTKSKLQKIIKSLNLYLKKHKLNNFYQIDVITIHNGDLEFIKNITLF
jgi:putative endonuclease